MSFKLDLCTTLWRCKPTQKTNDGQAPKVFHILLPDSITIRTQSSGNLSFLSPNIMDMLYVSPPRSDCSFRACTMEPKVPVFDMTTSTLLFEYLVITRWQAGPPGSSRYLSRVDFIDMSGSKMYSATDEIVSSTEQLGH